MKKLVTVAFSRTVLVEVPDGATVESLNDFDGPHAAKGFGIICDAAAEIDSKGGEITDIQDFEEEKAD